jgi:hypothetical protein
MHKLSSWRQRKNLFDLWAWLNRSRWRSWKRDRLHIELSVHLIGANGVEYLLTGFDLVLAMAQTRLLLFQLQYVSLVLLGLVA